MPWLKGRKGSKGAFGMCVKIKQTLRRKKRRLISSIKYKLNFNAETLLDLFHKWWCFDLEAQNVHGSPVLRAALSTKSSLQFLVLLQKAVYFSRPLKVGPLRNHQIWNIWEIFDHSPQSYTYPNRLSGSTEAGQKGTFCAETWESQSRSQAIRYHCFGISPDISSADWTGTI